MSNPEQQPDRAGQVADTVSRLLKATGDTPLQVQAPGSTRKPDAQSLTDHQRMDQLRREIYDLIRQRTESMPLPANEK
jgi:hypothetical protein